MKNKINEMGGSVDSIVSCKDLKNPNFQIQGSLSNLNCKKNQPKILKMKFKEWLLHEEKHSKTKSGKKVPGKYLSGLSEKGKYGSKEAMKKEIDKFRGSNEYKLNWDADYKDGKRIKTKKGKATKAFEKRFGESIINLDEKIEKALQNKAKKSGISVSTLRKVYNRGKAAWNSGHRPGVSQNQWAMGRINSFITGVGGARKADKDLWKKRKKRKK